MHGLMREGRREPVLYSTLFVVDGLASAGFASGTDIASTPIPASTAVLSRTASMEPFQDRRNGVQENDPRTQAFWPSAHRRTPRLRCLVGSACGVRASRRSRGWSHSEEAILNSEVGLSGLGCVATLRKASSDAGRANIDSPGAFVNCRFQVDVAGTVGGAAVRQG
jgi:hypothetical protein